MSDMSEAEVVDCEALDRLLTELDVTLLAADGGPADPEEVVHVVLSAAAPHIAAEALRDAAESIADAPHPVYATWADIAGLLRSRADRIEGGSDAG